MKRRAQTYCHYESQGIYLKRGRKAFDKDERQVSNMTAEEKQIRRQQQWKRASSRYQKRKHWKAQIQQFIVLYLVCKLLVL